MDELLFNIFLFSCTTAIGFIIGYYSRKENSYEDRN